MRHAGTDTFSRLEDLLEQLRAIDGLTEKRPGAFSRSSRAFLHFHEDPTGIYADVRLDTEFERFRVTTAREQQSLLRRVRGALAS